MGLDSPLKDWQLGKLSRWTIPIGVAAALASGISLYTVYQQTRAQQPEPAATQTPTAPAIETVTALGRLEPQGEVIKVSSSSSIEGARVEQLLVSQGDKVKQGQIVAVLDSRPRLQAALDQAKKDVEVARANLGKIQAGAKTGEIGAQRAEIARLQAQLNGEQNSRNAEIARLREQLEGDRESLTASIARWQAQQTGDRKSLAANVARLEDQLAGEKKTQQATIARLESQYKNAQIEYRRYQQVAQSGAFTASFIDSKRLQFEAATEQLNEAKANLSKTVATLNQQILEARANLNRSEGTLSQQIIEARANLRRTEATITQQIRQAEAEKQKTLETLREQIRQANARLNEISEIRPTDINAAKAEIERAGAAVRKAQADFDQAFVRSPINGQVLKVHTKAGETVSSGAGSSSSSGSSSGGIVDIGRTDQMYAIAEVYESDIGKIKLNQQAVIASETNAFSGELKGTVTEIGLQIGKKDNLSTDPAADVDARVVEVKIRLDPESSSRVSNLTYSKVLTQIMLENG